MHELEIQWQTYQGYNYSLQDSTDLVNWNTILTRPGDGTIQSHVVLINKANPTRFYRAYVAVPQGSEAMTTAITAWDATYVLLEWKPVQAGHFEVYRKQQLIANLPHTVLQHKDTSPQTGEYAVRWFSP